MKFGLRDDYENSFGCLPLQVITVVIALATAGLSAYFTWSLLNPPNFTDTRNIMRLLTVFSLLVACVLSLLVLSVCVPITARILFYCCAAAISSAVIETIVGWIYLAILYANRSETKPPPTYKDVTCQGIRSAIVLVLVVLSYIFFLGYVKSLISVLREGGTGWENLNYFEIQERRERGLMVWRPKYVNEVHETLRAAERKVHQLFGVEINIDAHTPQCSPRKANESNRREGSYQNAVPSARCTTVIMEGKEEYVRSRTEQKLALILEESQTEAQKKRENELQKKNRVISTIHSDYFTNRSPVPSKKRQIQSITSENASSSTTDTSIVVIQGPNDPLLEKASTFKRVNTLTTEQHLQRGLQGNQLGLNAVESRIEMQPLVPTSESSFLQASNSGSTSVLGLAKSDEGLNTYSATRQISSLAKIESSEEQIAGISNNLSATEYQHTDYSSVDLTTSSDKDKESDSDFRDALSSGSNDLLPGGKQNFTVNAQEIKEEVVVTEQSIESQNIFINAPSQLQRKESIRSFTLVSRLNTSLNQNPIMDTRTVAETGGSNCSTNLDKRQNRRTNTASSVIAVIHPFAS